MRIEYGKNVYGKEEISAVVKQLKKQHKCQIVLKNLKKK